MKRTISASSAWENSDIRRYLNQNFYNSFTPDERSHIVTTSVHHGGGIASTYDNIFLLSEEEAHLFFSGRNVGRYSANWGMGAMDDGFWPGYWLRTFARNAGSGLNVAIVDGGRVAGLGLERIITTRGVVTHDMGVRPALVLDLQDFPLPPKQYFVWDSNRVFLGDTIYFGGKDWKVLEINDDNSALIITQEITTTRSYHHQAVWVSWADSNLRAYLNGTYYYTFSDSDRNSILPTTNRSGNGATVDYVFVLSPEEAERLFTNSYTRASDSFLWLRSMQRQRGHTAYIIQPRGVVSTATWGGGGVNIVTNAYGIRPALRLSVETVTVGTHTPQIAAIIAASVGETIQFGGRDWRVLDIQGDYALILHETVLINQPYHHTNEDVTWETSSSRQWLNGAFLDSFSEADRARIRETTVINNDNPWYGTPGGENTIDRIFSLSLEEVVKYFGDSGMLQNAENRHRHIISDDFNNARMSVRATGEVWSPMWWTRSPGMSSSQAADVETFGTIRVMGARVARGVDDGFDIGGIGGLRPALWLSLE